MMGYLPDGDDWPIPVRLREQNSSSCHNCTTGRPSPGSDQILLLPATPRIQVSILFLLAAHRGQIPSVPTLFPRFHGRPYFGILHWDFLIISHLRRRVQ
jgi:hypothetical protein